jgi:hypothetical protein
VYCTKVIDSVSDLGTLDTCPQPNVGQHVTNMFSDHMGHSFRALSGASGK